jgi:hypothetical protein
VRLKGRRVDFYEVGGQGLCEGPGLTFSHIFIVCFKLNEDVWDHLFGLEGRGEYGAGNM